MSVSGEPSAKAVLVPTPSGSRRRPAAAQGDMLYYI